MNPELDDLEERLRSPDYLDDTGFTGRVMEALPPRRASVRGPVLLAAATMAGLVGAVALSGPLVEAARELAGAPQVTLLVAGACAILAAAGLARLGRQG
jgi:hypothetical protein